MILVTGANGNLGSETIQKLRQKNPGLSVAGFVRSEEKGAGLKKLGVEIRIGDYLDVDSVKKALHGVNTLLLISSSTLKKRVEQHKNVIDAAGQSGVQYIFYTSMLRAEKLLSPLTPDHYETEKILRNSGIPFTIHRHTFYTEFFPSILGNAPETGRWYFPGSGKSMNFAYRTEMAEALAINVSEASKHQGKTYEITSAEAFTFQEYARLVSEACGKTIYYKDLALDEYTNQLKKSGFTDDEIALAEVVAKTVTNGALDYTSGDLEKILGRKPRSVTDFIRNVLF